MNIKVNGEDRQVSDGTTVQHLLDEVRPGVAVAVLVNDDVVTAAQRTTRVLKDGDQVAVLIFAGGG